MLKPKTIKNIFLAIFFLSLFFFTVHFAVVGKAVYGDGIYYYAWVRSGVIDKDLNFGNELSHFSQPLLQTQVGKIANKFSFGPAFLWLPFFLLAHILSLIFKLPQDGYTGLYQFLVGAGSVVYGNLGLYFSFKTARFFYSQIKSLLAVILIFFGSNLFFYLSLDTINSHAVSFFTASLLLYLSLAKVKFKYLKYPFLGLITALLTSIRLQDIILSLTVFLRRKSFLKMFLFTIFLGLGFLPQLFLWQHLFGQINSPYLILGATFNLVNFNFLKVLFSPNNGLFFYSPILIFAFLGNLFVFKKARRLALSYFLIFFLQLYLISSWYVWWGGASYGGRMFISLAPFHILGLAGLLDNISKSMRKYVYALAVGLITLNMISIYLFLLRN